MKTIFKWAFRLFLLALVLLVVALLSLDSIARSVAEARLRTETGREIKLGKLEIGLLNPRVTVEHFVLYNSAEFGGSPLLDLAELHLEYDRPALRAGKLHLKLLRFNLAELNIVKSKDGKSNLEELKGALEFKKPKEQRKEFVGIDTLNLTLGKLRVLDMNAPSQAREFNVGVRNEIVTDLKTPADFQKKLLPILLKAGGNVLAEYLKPIPDVKPAPPPAK